MYIVNNKAKIKTKIFPLISELIKYANYSNSYYIKIKNLFIYV